MPPHNGPTRAVEQAFYAAVQEVVATAGQGRASVTADGAADGSFVIEVMPSRPRAAKVLIQVTPGFYVVEIGEGGRFEFVGKKGAPPAEDATEIARFVEAAILGLYSEKLWLRDGKVCQVWAKVKVGGRWCASNQFAIFPVPWFYSKELRQYESYV